jgi:hypothetical protein
MKAETLFKKEVDTFSGRVFLQKKRNGTIRSVSGIKPKRSLERNTISGKFLIPD